MSKPAPRTAPRPQPRPPASKPKPPVPQRPPQRTPPFRPKPHVPLPKTLPPGPTVVRILGRTLLRMAPFLDYLLTPTAIADGTISPQNQRDLARWKARQNQPGGQKLPPPAVRVSESAVSGAGIIGRWLEVVNTPTLELPVKFRDLGRVLGRSNLEDISDLLDQYSPAPRPDPSVDTDAIQHRGAVKKLGNIYDAHPDRAVRDLKDRMRRPYAENWLARNWWRDPRRDLGVRPVAPEPLPPVSPIRPGSKPAPEPAPSPSVPKPAPKPKPDPKHDPGPDTVPEVIQPPQLRQNWWPEMVIDVRANPPAIRFRQRLVRDRPPRRERDGKAERKGAMFSLHRLVTGGWGLYTEASDLVNMFIDNLRWSDTGKEFKGGRTRKALELFVEGKLELDTVGFMQDFAMNAIEDAVIGKMNQSITQSLDVQNPNQSHITHVQRLNRLNAERQYRTEAGSNYEDA